MKRVLTLLCVLLLAAGCAKPAPSKAPAEPSSPAPAPAPASPAPQAEPSPLTEGPVYLLSQPEKPLWPGPAAVVVENSPQSRPQAGLAQADLVVEMLAESEITRFLALYWSTPAEQIGPVRSARTGTVAIAAAYGAPYAHSGGNNDALLQLRAWGGRNIDEIFGSGQYFTRSSAREAPHNLYSSTAQLNTAIAERKLEMKAPLVTARAKDAAMPATGGLQTAEIRWHRLHETAWQWDGKAYRRTDDGQAHTLEGGQPVTAANLVFLEVKGENNGPDLGWTLFTDQGGKATVLSAGTKWEGTWTLGPGGFALKPTAGKVPLPAPGLTWVHMITQESSFAVK